MIFIRKEPLIVTKTKPFQKIVRAIAQCMADPTRFTAGVIHVNGK